MEGRRKKEEELRIKESIIVDIIPIIHVSDTRNRWEALRTFDDNRPKNRR